MGCGQLWAQDRPGRQADKERWAGPERKGRGGVTARAQKRGRTWHTFHSQLNWVV